MPIYMDRHDMQARSSAQFTDNPNDFVFITSNAAGHSWGLETSLAWQVSDHWRLHGSSEGASLGEILGDDATPDENVLHGTWSNPSYAVIDGRPQVIFPAGDGWVYSFEPKTGKILWKHDYLADAPEDHSGDAFRLAAIHRKPAGRRVPVAGRRGCRSAA